MKTQRKIHKRKMSIEYNLQLSLQKLLVAGTTIILELVAAGRTPLSTKDSQGQSMPDLTQEAKFMP